MATNTDHSSSSAAFEAKEEKSEKASFGPVEVKENVMSDVAQLSDLIDWGNEGSTVEKYPKLVDMTAEEQDEYFAEGLEPEEVQRVKDNIKKSGMNAMPSKVGSVVHTKGVGSGLSDQNSVSPPVEIPKGVSEMSSEEDKLMLLLLLRGALM